MSGKNNILFIYSFYRFIEINNKSKLKLLLSNYFKNKNMRGTILIANEGINASISGTEKNLLDTIQIIKKFINIRKLNININKNTYLPFNKIKVRLKKEIVSLGKGEINLDKYKGTSIKPSQWDKLIMREDIKVIDTRNTYEIDIGRFKNSINPYTNSFREFPAKFKKSGIQKNDKLAIYCTGGIRCEKAAAYLKSNGFNSIYQLEGGILNYLSYKKENNSSSLWTGDCFVFDQRVSVNTQLKSGEHIQCFGCRQPLNKEDIKSDKYKKGISCPYCFEKRSLLSKKRSESRQKQIELNNEKKIKHSFKKIYQEDIV